MKPTIVVNKFTKGLKTNAVLQGVTFPGERGTIFALLGGNGAEKTTMEA